MCLHVLFTCAYRLKFYVISIAFCCFVIFIILLWCSSHTSKYGSSSLHCLVLGGHYFVNPGRLTQQQLAKSRRQSSEPTILCYVEAPAGNRVIGNGTCKVCTRANLFGNENHEITSHEKQPAHQTHKHVHTLVELLQQKHVTLVKATNTQYMVYAVVGIALTEFRENSVAISDLWFVFIFVKLSDSVKVSALQYQEITCQKCFLPLD